MKENLMVRNEIEYVYIRTSKSVELETIFYFTIFLKNRLTIKKTKNTSN